jgi:DNA-3-methyladenine glycosylase
LCDVLRGEVTDAARRLLGSTVTSRIDGQTVAVRLTEVEAYDGATDPASHAHRGPTPRNLPMFDDAGAWYIYRSYGIHWCTNVVTGPQGTASAVLLRGGTIVHGRSVAVARRGREDHLADGPGKLSQALGITGALSGTTIDGGLISVELDPTPARSTIVETPRIGISVAQDRLWRFVLTE